MAGRKTAHAIRLIFQNLARGIGRNENQRAIRRTQSFCESLRLPRLDASRIGRSQKNGIADDADLKALGMRANGLVGIGNLPLRTRF